MFLKKKFNFIVESKGKAEAIRRIFPDAEIIVTKGSVFELDWTPIEQKDKRLKLSWKLQKKLALRPGETYFLATDPDEEGELQARLIAFFFSDTRFTRVHLFSLDPEEVKQRFKGDLFDKKTSDLLYRRGLLRRIFDRLLAVFFAQKGLQGMGRSQAGILNILANPVIKDEYIHSFAFSGLPGGLTTFSSSPGAPRMVVSRTGKARATTPPLSLARALARCRYASGQTFEKLYLSGVISYPRVSPKTWDDLPPPISLRRSAMPEDKEEREAIQVILQAHRLKQMEVQLLRMNIHGREANFIALPPSAWIAPDLLAGERVFLPTEKEMKVNIMPGDLLRKVASKRLAVPKWWMLTRVEEQDIARPSYMERAIQKLQNKGLIQEKKKNFFIVTEKGLEVREKVRSLFPELLEERFNRELKKRFEEVVPEGTPEEVILSDSFLKEVTQVLKQREKEELQYGFYLQRKHS